MSLTIGLTQLKRKKRNDGTIPIYIRFTEDRKSRYKSTGIAIKPKYWLGKNDNWISSSHPRDQHFNMKLKRQLAEIHDIEQELYKQDRLSMDALLAELSDAPVDTRSIIYKAQQYKKRLQGEDRYWEQRHFTVIINNLTSFIERKDKADQLDQLSAEWIENFQDWLLTEVKTDDQGNPVGGNSNNTVRKKLQRLKGMTDWLLKNKDIDTDPFTRVERVESKKTNSKVKLSFDQIKAIENLSLDSYTDLWHVRNYFMYSFYNAGIRFGDLCCLKWENLIDGRLVYKMNKTGGQKSIRQLEPMEKILNYYRNRKEQPEDYIFPLLERTYSDPMELRKRIAVRNVQVNERLKEIAKEAGIQANISFHVSRHSFAHYALKKGMDLYAISKALGHSDLKITQEYIKNFDEELLDKSMNNLFE